EYFRRVEANGAWIEPLRGDSPAEPQPTGGALYRIWPSGYQEQLAEFTCGSDQCANVLVADDGHFVTYDPFGCDKTAELLTIRGTDGSVVRTLRVLDVMTPNDQQWLCRGSEDDVRFVVDGATLRMRMLVTGGRWDASDARHHDIDVDLRSGKVRAPENDLCPASYRVTAEADDRWRGLRSDPDVVTVGSQALLDRAVARVLPEYAIVALKARMSGTAVAQVIVGTDGNVEEVSIVQPLPFGLDDGVRTAMKEWRFTPAPTRVAGVLAFRFEILRAPRLTTLY
nr:energy transducer TonB [Acidobacteriota bacterium]